MNFCLKTTPNTKPKLKIPPELVGTIQAGKPYLVFRPFEQKSGMQFISLSRRYLNKSEHSDMLLPIEEFIGLAKEVKKILVNKGLEKEKLGYSRPLSNLLSKLVFDYNKDNQQNEYVIKITLKEGDKSVGKEFKFSNVEAEKMVSLYQEYLVPDTQVITAVTEKEILNLIKNNKARNLTFEDGTTVYGKIISYDSATKTFVVKDIRNDEEVTKAGAVSHTSKSYTGRVQGILDNIMNSNGHLSSRFTSVKNRVGFITDKDRTTGKKKDFTGYKFMGLLGSKTAPVAKTYNDKGEPETYFEDVIDILENLFNFTGKGELPGINIQTINNEGNKENVELKFRVPVPLNARDENGQLTHDYQNANSNTSRDTTNVSNSKFFETNFEGMLPAQVYVEFGEERPEEKAEEKKEETVDSFVERIKAGQNMTSPEDLQFYDNNKEEIEKKLKTESQVTGVKNLTEDDINELTFKEIRERLTPKESAMVDDWAAKNGFVSIDNFFLAAESEHEDEQVYYKDYLIKCLL